MGQPIRWPMRYGCTSDEAAHTLRIVVQRLRDIRSVVGIKAARVWILEFVSDDRAKQRRRADIGAQVRRQRGEAKARGEIDARRYLQAHVAAECRHPQRVVWFDAEIVLV